MGTSRTAGASDPLYGPGRGRIGLFPCCAPGRRLPPSAARARAAASTAPAGTRVPGPPRSVLRWAENLDQHQFTVRDLVLEPSVC